MSTFRLLTGEMICTVATDTKTCTQQLSEMLNVPQRRLSICTQTDSESEKYIQNVQNIQNVLILPLQGICIQDENTIQVTIGANDNLCDIVHDVREFLEQNRDYLPSITHLFLDVHTYIVEAEYLDQLGRLLSEACFDCESLTIESVCVPVNKLSIRSQERRGKVVPQESTFSYNVHHFWRYFQGMLTRMECNLRKSTMHIEHLCAFKRLTHLKTAVGSITSIYELIPLRLKSLTITNPLYAFSTNAWSVEEGAARMRDRFPDVNVTVVSTGLRQMLKIEYTKPIES